MIDSTIFLIFFERKYLKWDCFVNLFNFHLKNTIPEFILRVSFLPVNSVPFSIKHDVFISIKTNESKMSEKSVKDLKISGLPKGGKLKQSDIDFMKLIESQNLERVQKLQKTRKNNILVGKNRNLCNL